MQEMDNRDTCIINELVELEDKRKGYPIIHRAAPEGKGIQKTLKLGFLSADKNGLLSLKTVENRIQLLKDTKTDNIIEKKIIIPAKTLDSWLYSSLGLNGHPIPFELRGKCYYLLSIHSGRTAADKNDSEVVYDYKIGFIICDKYFNTVYVHPEAVFSPDLTEYIHKTRQKWWVKWVRISAGHFLLDKKYLDNNTVELKIKMLITTNDTEIRSCICELKIAME